MSNAHSRPEFQSLAAGEPAAAAARFAADANARGRGRFDYTYRSLHDLDAMLEGAGEPGGDGPASVAGATAYLGEVLVRQYGCRRGTADPADLHPAVDLLYPPSECSDGAPVDVREVIARRLSEHASIAIQVLDAASGWFTPPVARPKPGDLPGLMHACAQAFVAPAKASGTMWLDFSPESVYRLDAFIAEGWPERPPRQTYEKLIPGIGAYLGEVLAAETGAVWIRDPAEGYGLTLAGVTAWPMNKVGKRFALGSRHSLGHFYREVSNHWRSGNDLVPVTWRTLPEEPRKRRLGLWRR